MSSIRVYVVPALLMFTIACGSSSSSPSPAAPTPTPPATPAGPTLSVSIPVGAATLGTRAFNPALADVAIGATITWTNADSVAHTSTSDLAGWTSNTIAPGGRFSVTYANAGTFAYHCAIHPGMVGTVVVH